MRIGHALLALALAGACFADTLTLHSGRVVNGTYLGGTSRQVRMEVGDRIETFDVSTVASIQFTGGTSATPASAPAAEAEAPRTRMRRDRSVLRPETSAPSTAPAAVPAASTASGVEIPAGTEIVIRMIDKVDSEVNTVGQTFAASVDEPVIVGGKTVVPRNADAIVKLVDDREAGKLTGRTELALDIVSIKVDGRMVDINTQAVTRASESRTGRTATMATGGAALGAIIGAIAGGGKGAAIGAVSGAGAGTAVQVMTRGPKVQIPSETRLTFTLEVPVKI